MPITCEEQSKVWQKCQERGRRELGDRLGGEKDAELGSRVGQGGLEDGEEDWGLAE